MNWFSNTTEYK